MQEETKDLIIGTVITWFNSTQQGLFADIRPDIAKAKLMKLLIDNGYKDRLSLD